MNKPNKDLKILLVEDEEIAMVVNRTLLKNLGYTTVSVATNGEDAIQKAYSGYDVIFMDIGLPDISGIEATKKILINENIFKRKTKIFALTAYTQKEIHNQCREAGMDDVILKPVDKNHLKNILDSI